MPTSVQPENSKLQDDCFVIIDRFIIEDRRADAIPNLGGAQLLLQLFSQAGFELKRSDLAEEDFSSFGGRQFAIFARQQGCSLAIHHAAQLGHRLSALVLCEFQSKDVEVLLSSVMAPTLCLVGEDDPEGIARCRYLLPMFGGETQLEIVPGPKHLFESNNLIGTEAVAYLAIDWIQLWFNSKKRMRLKQVV